jgi:glycerate-2-kinase
LEKAGIAPFPLTETPKDPHLFSRVTNILFVTNQIATQAMGKKARELGYTIKDYSEFLEGEARTAGGQLQNELAPKTSVIAAGETTVKVIGHGRGGRNQELVLGSLARIQPNQVLISIGSDGIDNSTQFAGALADTITIETAAGLNLSPADFLDNNDSTAFFEQTNAGIITGKLPSNVSDLMLALQS